VLVDFLCRVSDGVLRSGSDAEDARWVARKDLGAYSVASLTLRVIEKAFGLAE
jgi:hypothetical protein